MKKISLLLVACMFSGVACWPFDGEEAQPDMTVRRESEEGKVEILRAGERIQVGANDEPIQPGDVVRTYKGALAQVALEGERAAWIGGTEQVVDGAPDAEMRIIDTMSVESETGTVLAEADEAMKVRFGDATATTSDGVFRIDRRAGSARAGSFSGTVRLAAPGEPNVTLPRLYEASATANDFRASQPYRLDPEDPFDAQRLESIITLEGELGQLSAGFANQLSGNQRPSLGYFRVLANGKDVSAMRPYLKRPTIELLLGFTVATNTDEHPFSHAIREAFRHRDAGGSWGIVAAILRSQPKALIADLSDIIVGSGAVAGGEGDTAQFDLAAAEAAQTGEAPPTVNDGDPSDPTVPDDPDPRDPDPDEPDPEQPDEEEEPAEDCTDGIDCTQEEVRERIVPEPDPIPSDFIDL